jgi:hypothetical protein
MHDSWSSMTLIIQDEILLGSMDPPYRSLGLAGLPSRFYYFRLSFHQSSMLSSSSWLSQAL